MTIKRIRLSAGLTQKEFCDKYEIPLKTLQNWESNKDSASYRECPPYVIKLLEQAVIREFPSCKKLLETEMDDSHFLEISKAKKKIQSSPLADYVLDVLLYGSTARGQSKASSDLDILLVLDENIKTKKNYNNWIIFLKGNISSDDFSTPETDLHIVFNDNWKDSNDAYFANIKQEGFSIWN